MRKYLFKIVLSGYGDNPDEAWRDAASAANLEYDPTPDDYQEDDYDTEFNDLDSLNP